MTAPAVSNTFANNTTADASQVNTNFSDLVNYISTRNDGSATWDRVLITNATAVPLILNNSSGTNDIFQAKDNGSIVFSIIDGGNIGIGDTSPASAVYGGSVLSLKGALSGTLTLERTTATARKCEIGINSSGNLGIAIGGAEVFQMDVNGDFWSEAYTDYSDTSTIIGWASFTLKKIFYKSLGKIKLFWFTLEGTSDANSASFTLPYTHNNDGYTLRTAIQITDNGTTPATPGMLILASNSSNAILTTDYSGATTTWTTSGVKRVRGMFVYQSV